ncbi:SDR family oxidoreductase [Streptomyces sp. WMMB 322]|uniref:SDR family oxidoreductase n=1 Tax=Streptomyces sp. WMMB 322 TaxID=1286821 RepID=UPI0006E20A8B|nr:SDR family oxidoreductase [Streptomyces sp. WMMB 322]SCK45415.1 NAD(P)-dependent dehydrogenase, short-chain alcohol dehydrogenase family [Streptomyces sp. WMMB 322]
MVQERTGSPHGQGGPAAKVAVVTGSESGIGRATALALARDGFDIGVTWFADEADAQRTAEEVRGHGRSAQVRHLDLTRLPGPESVIDEFADALGGLDVLVNAAGDNRAAPFTEMAFEDFRHVMQVDLEGPFLLSQRAARRMIGQGRGGRIINITSVHEHTPLPSSAAYNTAKHGLGGLTKSMALELAEHGVTVNAVAPGLIATRMSGLEGADVHTVHRAALPVARPGDPREIASLVAWLASDAAAYATGQSYPVDGGFLIANPQFTTSDLGAGEGTP